MDFHQLREKNLYNLRFTKKTFFNFTFLKIWTIPTKICLIIIPKLIIKIFDKSFKNQSNIKKLNFFEKNIIFKWKYNSIIRFKNSTIL